MYKNNNIPPNPINGNMVGISNTGYNNMMNMGGYYTGYYNNYYNPYLAIQQQRIKEIQMKEQMQSQTNMFKNISKCINEALGNDVNKDTLNEKWDTKYSNNYMTEEQKEEQKTCFLINLSRNKQSYEFNPNQVFIQMSNNIHNNYRKNFPDNTSLFEFCKKGHIIFDKIIQEKLRKNQKNLSKLYNSEQYNQLIKMHSNNSSYFNSIFCNNNFDNNINIDDAEIKLPNHIKNAYNEKKKKFLESILK